MDHQFYNWLKQQKYILKYVGRTPVWVIDNRGLWEWDDIILRYEYELRIYKMA
jgi:hypothetical protein